MRMVPAAADELRAAIRGAGGVEVFAIGDVDAGHVVAITVTCRGREDRVTALIDRPRPGQVVIHNHPSGDLRPSDADLQLASMYGEDGVGVVIVDSDVRRDNWVVEPWLPERHVVDDEALVAFFEEGLPRALDGWEARPQQIQMAREVARCLDEQRPLMCEAGTGTGKSLAYLVPAALWALANESKVVVSTFTKSLQGQLVASDLPLLAAGGIEVKTAVLQGRNNYLCKRRLELAVGDAERVDAGPDEAAELQALVDWSEHTTVGSRSDIGFQVHPDLWERVLSDSDLTMGVRCPHYAGCHYYRARREAAAAHVIVVNHALLLTDLALRAENGRGFLPRYDRVIIDEGHHLEDAATGVSSVRLSERAVARAVSGLRDTQRRRGALSRLVASFPEEGDQLAAECSALDQRLEVLGTSVAHGLELVAERLITDGSPVRVTEAVEQGEDWSMGVVPAVRHIAQALSDSLELLDKITTRFAGPLPEDRAQPILDVRRGQRKLTGHLTIATGFLDPDPDHCRWVEKMRLRGRLGRMAALCRAPVHVAPVLKHVLWSPIEGTAATSATLTVSGTFAHWARRVGLRAADADEVVFASPFDHERQAVLGLPKDLPTPDDPRFLELTGQVIVEAVALSDGGAFVLCTSYAAVRAYAETLRREGGRRILAQGELGREVLLRRFREDPRSVLVGTDSFWEGVSVRGDGLRLVVIPRVPFRVPTEPLMEARHERVKEDGGDPFRHFALPEAVLRLRQGYGRLIRSHSDRGVVLLLDRRLHERQYGRIILRSLPPARRVVGPWRRVKEAVAETFRSRT